MCIRIGSDSWIYVFGNIFSVLSLTNLGGYLLSPQYILAQQIITFLLLSCFSYPMHMVIYIFFPVSSVGVHPNGQNLSGYLDNLFFPIYCCTFPHFLLTQLKVSHYISVYSRSVLAIPHSLEQIHLFRNFGPSSSFSLQHSWNILMGNSGRW